MRHIPEEELHAYLDQALSRSQCIEIETHLAQCLACAVARDAIAALRDRTTALLDSIAPPRVPRPPAYEALRGQALRRRPRPLLRYGLWAASLGGAVLAGWALRTAVAPPGDPIAVAEVPARATPQPEAPAVAPVHPSRLAPVEPLPPLPRDPTRFTDGGGIQLATRGPSEPLAEPVVPTSRRPTGPRLALDATWVPLTLEAAAEVTGRLVPLVPDFPIVAIHSRQVPGQARPVLVVSQEHPVAGLIHTVEGPVAEVAHLVASELWPDPELRASEPTRSLPDYGELDGAIQRISRVLVVVGRLPVDSLNALAQAVVLK